MTDKTYVIWWCLYINSRNATSQCILKTLTAKFGSWGISAFIDEKPRVWFILTFKWVMHDSEQTFSSQMLIFAYISQMIRCLQLDINWRTMDLTGKIMLLCMLHQWSKRQDWKSPRWAWGEQVLGDRKDICLVKSWMLVCWWWWFDWSFVHLSSPTVTTTAIILSSNKIQNGGILVPANHGCPGKWSLNELSRHSHYTSRNWPMIRWKQSLNGVDNWLIARITFCFTFPAPVSHYLLQCAY